MKYLIVLSLIVFSTCRDKDIEEFKKSCPYELAYSGHYLRIPITITPHQLTYHIGDTISINTIFSDSIYDLGTQQIFQIQGFPFKPLSLLYRFHDELEWDAGYRVNELRIDSIYKAVYNYSSEYADGYRAYTIYQDNEYRFESQLVLREPGRYILVFTDLYQEYLGTGNSDYNAEADAITFEGKCPTLKYFLCSMIEGDDQLDHFEEELVYLDTTVYRGGLSSIEGSQGPLRFGPLVVEIAGYFGFEVIE